MPKPYRPNKKTKHIKIQKGQSDIPNYFLLVEEHIIKGEKLGAVKTLSEWSGCGLRMAKLAVENVIVERTFHWDHVIKKYL